MQRKFEEILANLRKDKISFEFREPVDWETYQLWDYPEKIKRPMDLQTVGNNISKYKNPIQFFEDINQIWTNCKIYNIEGSMIYKNAELLEKKTSELKKKYFPTQKKKKDKSGSGKDKSGGGCGEKQKKLNQATSNLAAVGSYGIGQKEQISQSKLNQEKIQQKTQIEIEQKLNLGYCSKNCNDEQLVEFIKIILDNCSLAAKYRNDQLSINLSNLDQQTALLAEHVFKKKLQSTEGKEGGN